MLKVIVNKYFMLNNTLSKYLALFSIVFYKIYFFRKFKNICKNKLLKIHKMKWFLKLLLTLLLLYILNILNVLNNT